MELGWEVRVVAVDWEQCASCEEHLEYREVGVGMLLEEQMERGDPQRKTVYRICVTLVKRESLHEAPQEPRLGTVGVEEEAEGGARGFIRRFRTFSTGQLELGRVRASRRVQKEPTAGAESAAAKVKRLLKARSVEDKAPPPGTNGSPPKPRLLQRSLSFSFRNRIGGDRRRAPTPPAEPPAPKPRPPDGRKSRTLEVGAVLSRTDSLTELGRQERAGAAKNRTLDNSDLQRRWGEGGGRCSDRRLGRFLSGMFSRGDGSPGWGRSLRRGGRTAVAAQSSSESVDGVETDGNHTHTCLLLDLS